MVDWRLRRLVHWVCLNCVHHGGRVPRKEVGFEPQIDSGVSTPRRFRRAGPVAGNSGAGSLAIWRKVVHREGSLSDRWYPAACSRLDMNHLGLGRRVLPNRRVHQPRRPVGPHGLPPDMHGPGHVPRWETGPAPASSRGERAPQRACPFVKQRSSQRSPRGTRAMP